MDPLGYKPTQAQAEAIVAFRPRLLAARAAGVYERAVLARQFMDALHETGFVVADDFLPWEHAWRYFAEYPPAVETLDLYSVQLTFTFETLFDFEIEGRFMEFAYSDVATALLRRIGELYGLPPDAGTPDAGAGAATVAAAPSSYSVPWVPRRPQ